MNPYQVLGVSKTATLKEIKSAYRKISMKVHPDNIVTGDREKFDDAKLAYDVLRDPERRERYDATGFIEKSRVKPEAVRQVIAQTVLAIVTATGPDGSPADDPVWEDIRKKVIATIKDGRRQVQNNMSKTQRQMERTQRMLDRFKSKTTEDPVGDALRAHKQKLKDEMSGHQDAFDMSVELEAAFKNYDYEVGPGPEGQFSPDPNDLRRGRAFLIGSGVRFR